MGIFYIHCNEEHKEMYYEKMKKYFPLCCVKKDIKDCTDILCIGAVEDGKRKELESYGKKMHYLDENLLTAEFEEKMNVLL